MEQTFCYTLDSAIQDENVLAARCASAQRKEFHVNAQSRDTKVLSMAQFKQADADAAGTRGYTCVLLCRGKQTEEGMMSYIEPTFVSVPRQWPECPEDEPAVDAPWDGNDHSVEIHAYYIRFSGDSRGWLDVVTKETLGDGVITKPVSVKAAHNWAEHARRYDPEVFLAGIMEP